MLKLNRQYKGLEFPTFDAARAHLIGTMGEITKDALPDGERHDFIGEMRDETGKVVLRVSLSLKVERP